MFGSEFSTGLPTAHGRGRRSVLIALAFLPGVLSLVGCGEKQVPVFPVVGKVSVGGQTPVGAQVVLHSTNDSLPPNVAPSGTVKEDGTFEISVYKSGDGAPVGDYVATIQWFKVVQSEGGSGRGPNVLPGRYADPTSSPIRVTVNSQPNQIDPIEITKE